MPKYISIVGVEKPSNKHFARRSALRTDKPTTEHISSGIVQRKRPSRIITSLTR
ncbi:MAG: hypothetical protein ACI9VO_001482 [Colwellia sp.]|jgi:hypothetical protein